MQPSPTRPMLILEDINQALMEKMKAGVKPQRIKLGCKQCRALAQLAPGNGFTFLTRRGIYLDFSDDEDVLEVT